MKKILLLIMVIIMITPAFAQADRFMDDRELILSSNTFYGEAVSSKSGKSWPLAIEFWQIDSKTDRFEGMISWPSIKSVNAIKGTLSRKRFYFRESEHIKNKRAHLNVEYFLNIKGDTIKGKYKDPAGDYGKIVIKLKYNGKIFNFRKLLRENPTYFGVMKRKKKKIPFDIKFNGKLVTELQDFQGEIITRDKLHLPFNGIFMNGVLEIRLKDLSKKVYKLHFNYETRKFEGRNFSFDI